MHQAAPVAPGDEVALDIAEPGALELGLGRGEEGGAPLGDDQVVQEPVQPVGADAASIVNG